MKVNFGLVFNIFSISFRTSTGVVGYVQQACPMKHTYNLLDLIFYNTLYFALWNSVSVNYYLLRPNSSLRFRFPVFVELFDAVLEKGALGICRISSSLRVLTLTPQPNPSITSSRGSCIFNIDMYRVHFSSTEWTRLTTDGRQTPGPGWETSAPFHSFSIYGTQGRSPELSYRDTSPIIIVFPEFNPL